MPPPWAACCPSCPHPRSIRGNLLKRKPTHVPLPLSTLQWLASHAPRRKSQPHLAGKDRTRPAALSRLLTRTSHLHLLDPNSSLQELYAHCSGTMPSLCQAFPGYPSNTAHPDPPLTPPTPALCCTLHSPDQCLKGSVSHSFGFYLPPSNPKHSQMRALEGQEQLSCLPRMPIAHPYQTLKIYLRNQKLNPV